METKLNLRPTGRGRLLKFAVGGVAAAASALAAGSSTEPIATGVRPPNILLILADDMGFSDAGCFGGEIATPNIDRLGYQGLRFRQFYTNAVCIPTRTSLMSGLYPQRAGYLKPGGNLFPQVPTLAERLRAAGYRTYLSGKWHLGNAEPRRPRARGFDHFFGILEGASNYFKSATIRPTAVYLEDQKIERPDDFYMTDAITDHAVDFLRADAESPKPFFLYLAYTAPHFPLQARPADIALYRNRYLRGWDLIRDERYRRQVELGIFDGAWKLTHRSELANDPTWDSRPDKSAQDLKMAVYAAQITSMDRGIGRVLSALREIKADQTTLIFFLSDNGADAARLGATPDGKKAKGVPPGPAESYDAYGVQWASVSNTPFSLYKTWVNEGGIADPLIAYWPGKIARPGGFSDEMIHVTDVTATCLEAAGANSPSASAEPARPALDGISFLPTLRGEPRQGHEDLCWCIFGDKAIRRGKWKLVSRNTEHVTSSFQRWRYDPAPNDEKWRLYDIAADRTETTDLAAENPELVQELKRAYEAWAKRVGAPEGYQGDSQDG